MSPSKEETLQMTQLKMATPGIIPEYAGHIIIVRLISDANDFNPRARKGRDFYICSLQPTINISIHAPAGGATSLLCVYVAIA